jgi:multidrug efflux system outer membrane protein
LVYTATQTIADIERLIEQTENRISLLVGKNPGDVTRGRSLTAQEQPPAVPPGLPSSLLERRPDIRAAEQNLVAANAIIGVAKAASSTICSVAPAGPGVSSPSSPSRSSPAGGSNPM